MKNKTYILVLLLSSLVAFNLVGCSNDSIVVNVSNSEELNSNQNIAFGRDNLINIGDCLWYDSTTRIVYWWNGYLHIGDYSTTPTPYYAPNGLPYMYNPETNTFEEIDLNKYLNEKR